MTKQETYDELVKRGATLNPVASYKADELKALLAATPEPGAGIAGNSGSGGTDTSEGSQSGQANEPAAGGVKVPVAGNAEPKKFPVLRFAGSGWCNEIGFSYTKGLYRPKSAREYEALRKYAVEEIVQ